MNQEALFTVIAPQLLEESLVDWLMENDPSIKFSMMPVFAHVSGGQNASIGEQVSGRRKKIRIDILIEAAKLETFRTHFVEAYKGADLTYWATPILFSH